MLEIAGYLGNFESSGGTGGASSIEVTKLKERVTELEGIVSQLPSVEGSGTDFKLENTMDAGLVESKVMGATWQEQYSGKNKFSKEIFVKEKVTYSGVTLTPNEDGSFALDGTNTATSSWNFNFAIVNGNFGKTMTLKATSSNDGLQIAVNNKIVNINTEYTITDGNITQFSIIIKTGAVFLNDIIYLQIEEGTTATAYEPYVGGTASPNVQFPQPIYNVSGDVVVKTKNKNFIGFEDGYSKTQANVTVTYNAKEGSFTLNGTAGFLANVVMGSISVKAGEYTLSVNPESKINDSAVSVIQLYDPDTKENFAISNSDNKVAVTRTITKDCNFQVRIHLEKKRVYENYKIFAMFEENSIATNFVAHKETSVTFPLAEGQVLCEGDYLADNGIHHVKTKHILTRNNNIMNATIFNRNTNYFSYTLPNISKTNRNYNFICNKVHKCNEKYSVYGGYVNSSSFIVLLDDNDTIETANEKLVGAIVEYPLAEEIVEAYTPAQQTAYNELKKLRSFSDVTYVVTSSNDSAPVVEVKALEDTNKRLNNIESRLSLLE